MPAKTHGERLDRLEEVVGLLAESQLSVENALAELATATRRGFDQVAAQFAASTKRRDEDRALTEARFRETDERFRVTAERFRETAERFRETDEQMRETDERMRETDERMREMAREDRQRSRELDDRVEKLVLAIAELIRKQDAPGA